MGWVLVVVLDGGLLLLLVFVTGGVGIPFDPPPVVGWVILAALGLLVVGPMLWIEVMRRRNRVSILP
jgi:hypothetical protein